MTNYDDPGTVQFFLGGLVHQISLPKFDTALGLYTAEFKEENDLHALNRHIHCSSSRCWDAQVPGSATYNPSPSKASALPPSLRYLHAILAHTIIGSTTAQKSSLTSLASCLHKHKDLLSQAPPPSHPVHAAASYADISERLTRFEHEDVKLREISIRGNHLDKGDT
ncbi:hypothetical protein GOBAR_AA29086 [Gossypium barbadense]|uniref:Uncharacterized protein n=1 Tax=Gossypium barbadense TaxID=3634 RepID=A0A2P5WKG9_GOSBA|nr:hypothetical protein GOBAR_AA29086 [Gossypium barbadense]